MERLTIPDEPIEGGMRRAVVDARAVKEQAMGIYWRLKAYEDTGLEPEKIMDGKMLTGWIPVEEGLPEKNATYCLVTTTRSPRIEMAWYLGGDWYWNNSDAKMGGVFAWMPLPEPYRLEALREAGAEAGQDAAEQVLQSVT